MSSKWFISTLLFIFVYLGAFHEQISVPNQEIVLEFVDTEVDKKDIHTTIDDVRKKLLKLGVSNIKIQENKSGTLKISYYSANPVDNIKEAFLDENQLVVNQNSENKEEDKPSSDYKINVYELTSDTDISNHKNKLVFENKYNSKRFTLNYPKGFAKNLTVSKADQHF